MEKSPKYSTDFFYQSHLSQIACTAAFNQRHVGGQTKSVYVAPCSFKKIEIENKHKEWKNFLGQTFVVECI